MTHFVKRLVPVTATAMTMATLVGSANAQDGASELADLRVRVEQLESAQSNLNFNLPGSTQVEIYR